MRILIVHNKNTNFASDAIYEFARAVTHESDECTLRVVSDSFDFEETFRDANEFDCVVLSGGDDTISDLLYKLRYKNIRCCVFPSGVTNVYFENLGCAAEPAAIARACRIGNTQELDLGEISWQDDTGITHTEGFCLMAGTGYDADLMRAAAPSENNLAFPYIKAAIANPEPEIQEFSIEVDGKVYMRQGIACMVANNGMTQGNINIAPDCVMDDGLLNVIMLEAKGTTELIKPLFASFFDSQGANKHRPTIEVFSGKDVKVSAQSPMSIQVDGRWLAGDITSYTARILPGANRIITDSMSPYTTKNNTTPLFSGTEEIPYPDTN